VAYESLVDAGWDNETKRCAAVLTAVEPAHLVLPLGGHQISRTASHMLSTGGLHRNFDLACASGYLAIAYGVELLRKNAALKCIVASSALNLQPACMVSLTQAGILCGTGMPRPLDANADGATIGDSFLHLAG
jgi:3-oxoacyl-(acyl-carrier-protein) synthase